MSQVPLFIIFGLSQMLRFMTLKKVHVSQNSLKLKAYIYFCQQEHCKLLNTQAVINFPHALPGLCHWHHF